MRTAIASVAVAITAIVGSSRSAAAQSSACLTNPDTASAYIDAVTNTITWGDSAGLVSKGIPYRPAQPVTLVTNSQTCSKLVAARNAPLPANDPARITHAYVMKIGNSNVYALVGKTTPSGFAVFYFDSKYNMLLATIAAN